MTTTVTAPAPAKQHHPFKTTVKWVVGLTVLAMAATMLAFCLALGSAVDETQHQMQNHSMTVHEYKSVHLGTTYKALVAEYGKPDPTATSEYKAPGFNGKTAVYWDSTHKDLSTFVFQFTNGHLTAKFAG